MRQSVISRFSFCLAAVVFGFSQEASSQNNDPQLLENPNIANAEHHVFCAGLYMSMVRYIGGDQINPELFEEISHRFIALNFTAANLLEIAEGLDFETAVDNVHTESMALSEFFTSHFNQWSEVRSERDITQNPFFARSFDDCAQISDAAATFMGGGSLPVQ